MNVAPPKPFTAGTPAWWRIGLAIVVVADCHAQTIDVSGRVAPAAPYLEVSGERMPRLADTATTTRFEAVGWSQRGSHAFGVALGATFDPARFEPSGQPMRSSLGVGLRWRSDFSQRQRLDVATWHSFTDDVRDPPALTTRIELQFASPQTALVDRGALGLQLSSDSKVAMRLRKGGPMVYYRSKF
jgi:hypothetical protein